MPCWFSMVPASQGRGQCDGFILQERGFKASRRNFQAQVIPMMESFCMGEVNYLNQRMRYSWMRVVIRKQVWAIWVL